jgi:hypothetical protein
MVFPGFDDQLCRDNLDQPLFEQGKGGEEKYRKNNRGDDKHMTVDLGKFFVKDKGDWCGDQKYDKKIDKVHPS